MSFLFLKLKNKFGKEKSNKAIMKMILCRIVDEEFGGKIEMEAEIIKISPVKNSPKPAKDVTIVKLTKPITRYISAAVKRAAITKNNHKCCYPNCNRPGEILHHRKRFATNESHDSLIYLCKDHHEFAHNGLIENEIGDVKDWNLNLANPNINEIDRLYRAHRLEN